MAKEFILRMDRRGRITVPKAIRILWEVDTNSEYELKGHITSMKKLKKRSVENE